jgi:hypothetical protein
VPPFRGCNNKKNHRPHTLSNCCENKSVGGDVGEHAARGSNGTTRHQIFSNITIPTCRVGELGIVSSSHA